jgi:transposase InsO family protein
MRQGPPSTFLSAFASASLSDEAPRPPRGLSPEQAREVGLAAHLSRGEYGAVAKLSREYGISRGDVEHCREAFSTHFQSLFAPKSLPTAPVLTLKVDREHIHRALILSRSEVPVSIRGLRRLSLNFLHLLIGFGTVWNVIAIAEGAAATWLSGLNLERVHTIALDELFCQGRWVLVVIDVKSQTLCGLKVVDSRTEEAWSELLVHLRDKQKLSPRTIVSDAGSGLVAAADELFPAAHRSHDIFHAKQALLELLEFYERRAYKALGAYYDALVARQKAKRSQRRSLGQHLRRAEEEADRRIGTHDKLYRLVMRAFDALEFIVPETGLLRRGDQAACELEAVARELSIMKDRRAKKVGTYLHNQSKTLTSYIDRLATQLMNMTETSDEQAVVLTTAAVYRIDRERATRFYAFRRGSLSKLRNRLLDSLRELDVTAERMARLFIESCRAITHSGRASSIVEGFNSIIRKFLQIHKRMTEGALMLVAARWTLARRECGPLAGSCPFTALTGEQVEDWLVMLGLFSTPAPTPTLRHLYMLEPRRDEGDALTDELHGLAQAA